MFLFLSFPLGHRPRVYFVQSLFLFGAFVLISRDGLDHFVVDVMMATWRGVRICL